MLDSPCLLVCPAFLQIFGATTEDVDKLRIVSLHEMDTDKLNALMQQDVGSLDSFSGDIQSSGSSSSSRASGGGSGSGSLA